MKVRYNEARYGRSDGFPCAGNVCSNTWYLIQDAINVWVDQQRAAGLTDEQIAAELASFDVWDRYDYNNNGDFNEPDGYIDHFQIVHAGGDQSDGDPYQGEDAIWAHRWKVFQGTGEGPAYNPDGGTPVGDTGLWVADYTIQPENGGLSVFAHEYGHDIGLPDLYDTSGGGGDNAVGWWSIMAQSRLSDPAEETGHRHSCRRPRSVGEAAARLVRLRDRARRRSPHAGARAARVQHRQAARRGRGASAEGGRHQLRRAVRG